MVILEFDKTRWSCPWNSDQNCTQNSARKWWGSWGGGSGGWGGPGGGGGGDLGGGGGLWSKSGGAGGPGVVRVGV